jgi:hypothetical protein
MFFILAFTAECAISHPIALRKVHGGKRADLPQVLPLPSANDDHLTLRSAGDYKKSMI